MTGMAERIEIITRTAEIMTGRTKKMSKTTEMIKTIECI